MLKRENLVINTGPIIALVAATGNLRVLEQLYKNVFVPLEVQIELTKDSKKQFAVKEFNEAGFLIKSSAYQKISTFLKNTLDSGEAAVIQLAIDKEISTVCIDETAGRRVAKLNNLLLTGSIGILIKAKKNGLIPSVKDAILYMKQQGIYLSTNVVEFALRNTDEI